MEIVIGKLDQVSRLTADEKAVLRTAFSSVRPVEPGRDLLRYGERPAFVGALLEGVLCRYKTLASGARQIVAFIMPGEVFDLQSFMFETLDHSVGAITRATVATAAHSAVLALLGAQPRLRLLLWREAALEAAILREWVAICGRRSAYARMAHLFCEFYTRYEHVGLAGDGHCPLPLTQAILSDATGLSTVHVNRVLQQLRAEGLISLKAGRLTIHDMEGLANAAEFDPAYLHLGEPTARRADARSEAVLNHLGSEA